MLINFVNMCTFLVVIFIVLMRCQYALTSTVINVGLAQARPNNISGWSVRQLMEHKQMGAGSARPQFRVPLQMGAP